MPLLDNLVSLAKLLKYYLKLDQVEVLCHLVECLATAIERQKKEIDFQDKSSNDNDFDDLPEKMSTLFKELDESVASFVESNLFKSLEYSTDEQWHEELQVIIFFASFSRTVIICQKMEFTITKCVDD